MVRFVALFLLADVEVLAEDTFEIAHREKNCAAAMYAPKAVLLAKMRKETCNRRVPSGFANRFFIIQTIDPAVAWAYLAIGKTFQRLAGPPIQLASAVQVQISRLEFLRPDYGLIGRFGHSELLLLNGCLRYSYKSDLSDFTMKFPGRQFYPTMGFIPRGFGRHCEDESEKTNNGVALGSYMSPRKQKATADFTSDFRCGNPV